MDEQQSPQAPAENESVAEDSNVVASPADEPNTSEPSEQETEQTASSAEEQSDETTGKDDSERRPSRAERRIRDLKNKLRQFEEEQSQRRPQQQPAPQPMFEDGREYTAAELEQRLVQQANAIAGLQTQYQINRLKAETNLDRDIDVLPTKFPELDENNEDYSPELADSIIEEYKSKVASSGTLDPSVRLSDIAERQVKAARAVAKKSQAKMKSAVAASADTAAVKPTGTARQDKSLDQMSSAEIEAMMKKQGRYVKA